jgi:hypothetical protein
MIQASYGPEAEAFYARFAPDGVATEGAEERAPMGT